MANSISAGDKGNMMETRCPRCGVLVFVPLLLHQITWDRDEITIRFYDCRQPHKCS